MNRLLSWLLERGEKDEPFELEFSQLSEWLGNYSEKNIGRDIATYGLLLKLLSKKVQELDKVSIENIQAEKKLKDLVKGNKPAYTNALRILIQKIEPPRSYSLKSLENFCKQNEDAFDEFNKKTVRNYAILKTIIGKELAEIVELLKQLEVLSLKLNDDYIKNSKLKTIEDLRNKLAFFYEFEASKEAMGRKLMSLHKRREEITFQLKSINEQLQNLRIGPIFKDYEKLNLQLSELGAEELRIKGTLSAMVSELSRPLRKLDQKSRLITRYTEDAYLALLEDRDLEFSGLLQELQKKIENNKIEVKNKHKSLDQVLLYRTELKRLQERINSINFQRSILTRKLSDNEFEVKEKQLINDFSRLQNEFSELMLEKQQSEEKGKEFNIQAIAQDIERLIGRKVTINNAPIM